MATYIENIAVQDVRDITGLSTSDITDSQVTAIISGVVAELNNDIQVRYERWRVTSIDTWRTNKIDGSNTVFFVPKYPIGDFNDDGKIDTNDVKAYEVKASGTEFVRNNITISSITDDEQGKVTLASAPASGASLYLEWSHTPLEMETPHRLIKRAIVQLAGSMAYSRVDAGKVSSFRVGKVAVTKQSEAFRKYMDDYKRTVFQINSHIVERGDFKLIDHGVPKVRYRYFD